jgi:hypothetical protein
MNHPLESIPSPKRRWLFLPLLVLTLAVMAVLNGVDRPLVTEAAPRGIVSFELAGDVSSARAILDSWDARARAHAGFSLGFDFVFLILYSTTIACACAWGARGLGEVWRPLAPVGPLLAWGQWLAGLLDAVENTALWVILADGPSVPWPRLAWWCAAIKFTLVALGLLCALLSGLWLALKRESK